MQWNHSCYAPAAFACSQAFVFFTIPKSPIQINTNHSLVLCFVIFSNFEFGKNISVYSRLGNHMSLLFLCIYWKELQPSVVSLFIVYMSCCLCNLWLNDNSARGTRWFKSAHYFRVLSFSVCVSLHARNTRSGTRVMLNSSISQSCHFLMVVFDLVYAVVHQPLMATQLYIGVRVFGNTNIFRYWARISLAHWCFFPVCSIAVH